MDDIDFEPRYVAPLDFEDWEVSEIVCDIISAYDIGDSE